LFVLETYSVFKIFSTFYASSSVVTLHIFCLCFFVCFVHTSHNRHEFHIRSLRFSFLSIPYCFRVSSLAENKLFLMPKLSNVPTNFLPFLPLLSRYVHQKHYCICCCIIRGKHIILLFLPPISRELSRLYYCFYYQ